LKTLEEKRKYAREWKAAWRKDHRDKDREISNRYRRTHKDLVNERRKMDRIKDPDKYKRQDDKKAQKHKEQYGSTRTPTHARYYKKNKKEVLRKARIQHQEIKKFVLTHYGEGKPACVLCGYDKLNALSIDHIDGGGHKHRQQVGTRGGQIYGWLIKNNFPEGFRTLCMNCQFLERYRMLEYGK
jgi:hypothetical protein